MWDKRIGGVKDDSEIWGIGRKMKFPYLRQETIAGEPGSVRGMGARAEGGI